MQIKTPTGMKTASIWVVWMFLVIGALGGALFVVLQAFDAMDDAAAWIQAVGSIAAIVAAFMVANNAHERQVEGARRSAQESEARAAHLAECAAYEAILALGKCANYVWDPLTANSYSAVRLRESRRVLRGTLAQPLPNKVVSGIFSIQEELSETIGMLEGLGPLGANNEQIKEFKRRAKTSRVFYATIQQEYLAICSRAGVSATVRVGV